MNAENNYKILVVDDEKSNLEVLNRILKESYSVYTAKSGETAIKRAYDISPDLILLDVIMPDMNGFEVLTELKNDDITENIPVIFITGLNNDEDEKRGLNLGAVDYITKPFNSEIVKARVKTHMQIIKQMRMIEKLGMIDLLTEIPNRRSFDYQLNVEWSRAIREKTPISLLMINVDNIKKLSEEKMRSLSDLALQKSASAISSVLKRSSDITARYGSEVFAVILPNTNADGGLKLANDIREKGSEIKLGENGEEIITFSIGISSATPAVADSVSTFILQAERNLFKAKSCENNKVCY